MKRTNDLAEPIMVNEKELISDTHTYVESYDPKCEPHSRINEVVFIRYNSFLVFIFVVLNILTACLINLVMAWWPKLQYKLLYSRCSVNQATKVMVIDQLNNYFYLDLMKYDDGKTSIWLFEFKLYRYLLNFEKMTFDALRFESDFPVSSEFHRSYSKGLSIDIIPSKRFMFSICNLNFEINSYLKLALIELTDPFYLFQAGSVLLWFFNEYQKYATVILVTTVASLIISVYETRQNLLNIQTMAKYSVPVNILRSGNFETLSSEELVPGDVYEIPSEGNLIPADACLISGNVICNEALLTGESTPVVKENLVSDNNEFVLANSAKNVVYSGTKIIQKRGKCLAVVVGTGFNTEKGSLIRSILFPKEVKAKFESESVNFIKFMLVLGTLGYLISVPFMIESSALEAIDILEKLPDLITTVVPPALPACLAIGITYAIQKLKKKGITCIDRNKINLAGMVNLMVFDKTGTLTEDYLEIVDFKHNLVLHTGYSLSEKEIDIQQLSSEVYNYVKQEKLPGNEKEEAAEYNTYNRISDKLGKESDELLKQRSMLMNRLFIECLANCHTLTKGVDKMLGDPIDVKMFEKSNWDYLETIIPAEGQSISESTDLNVQIKVRPKEEQLDSTNSLYEMEVIRRFNFSSKLQRMTVVVKNSKDSDLHVVFSKGSPEKISELCIQETIPRNYNTVLSNYTSKGYRVLALAAKLVKISGNNAISIPREKLESKMIFLGLIIVQNKLKPETIPTLEKLISCNLKSIMATGDNILTAIAVARESKMIQPNASIFSCTLTEKRDSTNNSRKLVLEWEAVSTKNASQRTSFARLKKTGIEAMISEDNNNRSNLTIEDDVNRISLRRSQIGNNLHGGPSKKRSFVQNNNRKSFAEGDNLDKYYCYLDFIEEVDNKNTLNPMSDSTVAIQPEAIKQEEFNIEIDLERLPFERNSNQEDIVIVTNGSTFEKLVNLNNQYVESNEESLRIYYETLRIILKKGYVFARMSPDHKTMLVESLQAEGFNVCMCGDGANDCGALKAAAVGMSLSMEEASIAAPFTSSNANISCLIDLMLECKASLVTSFQCFRFMMMYSIIQFISVSLLNILNSYPTDNQYLTSDVFIIFPIAILLAKTETSKQLTKHTPINSLISMPMIIGIITHSIIFLLFQFFSYYLLDRHSAYDPDSCGFIDGDGNNPNRCQLNSVIFLISNMQYFYACLAISLIKNFKKPMYTNCMLVSFLFVTMTYSLYTIIFRDWFNINLLDVVDLDTDFRYVLLGFTFANFIASLLGEFYVVRLISAKWAKYKFDLQYSMVLNNQETLSLHQIHNTLINRNH